MRGCPSEEDLERLLAEEGGLEGEARAHVEACERCAAWLREARADEAVLGEIRRGLPAGLGRGSGAEGGAADPGGAQGEVPGLSRYEIVRKLGEGGMGIVYEAEQRRPRRRVALKLLRSGLLSPAMLRRFELEAQVLGRLDHPGIARIYEADTFEGPGGPQPFFAMELVRGRPLLEHVRAARLDPRGILDLAVEICEAVEHAHQKGVIHRDLKPANILVTEEGRPKILDFGVARTTDADVRSATLQTGLGQLVGTLPYMSPEQVAGDPEAVDTRSDVYALGVLLFEALAGRLPFDGEGAPVSRVARAIAERDAPRLGSLDRRLRGDVETIVAKALEKEKARRYPSASALAEDLRRHLRDEPIAARPASTAYLLGKFARGHRALVASFAALFAVLVLGVVGVALQARRARGAEREASARADEAEEALEFLVEAYGVGAGAIPLEATVQEALEDAVRRLEGSALSPRVEGTVELVIGNAFRRRGELAEAERHLERALALRRAAYGGRHPKVAGAENVLGSLRHAQGRFEEAEGLYRSSLGVYRGLEGPEAPQVASLLLNLSQAVASQGRAAEATSLCEEAIASGRRTLGDAHETVAQGLAVRAALHVEAGEVGAARARYREALAAHRASFGPRHPVTARCAEALARLLLETGEIDEAEALAREAIEADRPRRADRPEFAGSVHLLGRVLEAKGDLEGASVSLEEALARSRSSRGATHADTIRVAADLARALARRRDWSAAAEVLEGALADLDADAATPEPDLRQAVNVRATLANLLADFGALDAAAAAYRRLLALVPAEDERRQEIVRNNLASVLARGGDLAAAEEILDGLVAERHRAGEEGPLAIALNNLGRTRHRRGDLEAAERDLREALALATSALGEESLTTAIVRANLASVLSDAGRLADAEPLFAAAMPVLEAGLPADHSKRAEALAEHGRCLARLGRRAEAEGRLLAALQVHDRSARAPDAQTALALRDLVALYAAGDRPEEEATARARLAEVEARLAR